MIVGLQGDVQAGLAFEDESVAVLRQAGDKWALGYVLGHRGARYRFRRDLAPPPRAQAAALADSLESLSLLEELGDSWTIEIPLGALARIKVIDGSYAEARALQERSIRAASEIDNQFGVAIRLMEIAEICRAQGDYREAESLYARAHEMWRKSGNEQFAAVALGDFITMVVKNGDKSKATTMLAERLRTLSSADQIMASVPSSVRESLVSTAALWLASGQTQRAAQLLGAAAAPLGDESLSPWWRSRRMDFEHSVGAARAELDGATFAAAWAEGSSMTLPQAVEFALAGLEDAHLT
jgi:tetratricopeptide (TPR) repeat protein